MTRMATGISRNPVARPVGIGSGPMSGAYPCPEVKAMGSRADACAALQRPSRVGSRLHWPGGRVTDLQGNPITTQRISPTHHSREMSPS